MVGLLKAPIMINNLALNHDGFSKSSEVCHRDWPGGRAAGPGPVAPDSDWQWITVLLTLHWQRQRLVVGLGHGPLGAWDFRFASAPQAATWSVTVAPGQPAGAVRVRAWVTGTPQRLESQAADSDGRDSDGRTPWPAADSDSTSYLGVVVTPRFERWPALLAVTAPGPRPRGQRTFAYANFLLTSDLPAPMRLAAPDRVTRTWMLSNANLGLGTRVLLSWTVTYLRL